MKDNLSRAMLCLAALDLTQHELRELISELRSVPLKEIIARVSSLRQQTMPYGVDEESFQNSKKASNAQFLDASVGERVERLLKVEGGLTTVQAAEKLAARIVELGLAEPGSLPLLSKKSLHDWVVRVAQMVPAKQILRCATILRNEHAHSPIRDWTLSEPPK
jgi:hypothetical protein